MNRLIYRYYHSALVVGAIVPCSYLYAFVLSASMSSFCCELCLLRKWAARLSRMRLNKAACLCVQANHCAEANRPLSGVGCLSLRVRVKGHATPPVVAHTHATNKCVAERPCYLPPLPLWHWVCACVCAETGMSSTEAINQQWTAAACASSETLRETVTDCSVTGLVHVPAVYESSELKFALRTACHDDC